MFPNNKKPVTTYLRPMNRPSFTNNLSGDYTFASDYYNNSYGNYQMLQGDPQTYQQFRERERYPSNSSNNRRYQERDSRGGSRGRNNKEQKQFKDKGRDKERGDREHQRQRSPSNSTSSVQNEAEHKLYTCPGCQHQYECYAKTGRSVGKVPLVLSCQHTLCQECIVKSPNKDKVECPVCKTSSSLPRNHSTNIQEVFPPNLYVYGYLNWHKSQVNNMKHLALAPVPKAAKKQFNFDLKPEITATCCFVNCNQKAIVNCQDCNDVYCNMCSISIHQSAKSLWSHRQIPLAGGNIYVELDKCKEHNMDVEIYCKTCEQGACCYCFLEKHEGHEKDYLSKLAESEQLLFAACREKVENKFKQLLIAKQQLDELQNVNSSTIYKKICQTFINLHSKLQSIENSLLAQLSTFNDSNKRITGLENINWKINNNIQLIKHVLLACEMADEKKVNIKEIFKKLQELENIPCYLLRDQNEELEVISFSIDPLLDNIEEYFKISRSTDLDYLLVSEDALPEDYKKPDIIVSNDTASVLSSIRQNAKENAKKKKSTDTRSIMSDYMKQCDREMVEVTHIESLEKFYVQQKKAQIRLMQMNKDIENYVSLATMVDQPQLNELYLVQYITNKEKQWCRGRVVDVKNGETEPLYEVFFIDYGTTQTVDISKLREITSGLAQRKAFAIQCELYNPSYVSWSKSAHIHMGKIINGKELCMIVKGVQSGIHQVDLMVSSSDGGFASITDILIHAKNALILSSDDSLESLNNLASKPFHFTQDFKIFSNNTKFQKNQIEKVTIANIVDPHHIFVQNAAHADALKRLLGAMKAYYKRTTNTFMPMESSYVVVEDKDPIRGNWHRAFIKKVDLCTEQVHVKCVDWGTDLTVSFNNVRMLTESFTRLESQAIFVKLANIEPYNKAHVWSDRASQYLQRFFRTQDVLKMIVHSEDPLEAALFQMETDMDICINTSLVQEKLADSTGKLSQVLEWPQNLAEKPCFSATEDFVESMLKKVDESCEENESEDEEEKKHFKQKIKIVKFVNPDLIYIKFVSFEEREQSLYHELQVHYNKERIPKESLTPNDMCVVVYNKMYVRGIIIGAEEDKYRINIIDFVDQITTSKENIYEYAPYFLKYKSMVYKAYLANIRPAGGDKWSLLSIEALEKIFETHKEDIFATKVPGDGSNKFIPMKMWYTQVKIGGALEASVTRYISINNFLVKLGFAYKKLVNLSDESKLSDQESKNETEDLLNSSADSKDWNRIMEEEEKRVEMEMNKDNNDSPYHTREAEIKDWKPPFPIDKQEFNAYVTCAEPEGILHLREENLQPVYEELEKNIKEYFDNKPDKMVDINHNWQPGQLCSIAYNDYWYRGRVDAVNSPDDIVVVMIDFGSDHHVTPKDLFRELLYPDVPAFASKIKLDRIYPKCGKWLTSDYEMLLKIVTEYTRVEVKGLLDVPMPLAEVYTDKGLSVNEALVKNCPNLTRTLNWKRLEHSDEEDNVLIEEEEALEIKGSPVDTTGFKYKIQELPKENSPMFIVTIIKYNQIVIKKPAKNPDIRLAKLLQEIQKYAEFQPVIEKIELNAPCIAKYSEDKLYYRAQVHNIDGLSGGYVLVYYVDFGNVESVLVSEVKMMRPEWFDLPITCHMAELNFKMKSDNHLEYVFQIIRKLFGKTKMVQFIKREPLVVDLLEENGELAYQTLITSGFIEVIDKVGDINGSEDTK